MGAEENGVYFTFITALSLVAVFLIAYAISIVRNLKRRHRRYREFALRDAKVVESERKRISEDLHDDFGSTLAALRLGLETINEQFPGNALIEKTSRQLDETNAKLRSISNNLLPKTVVAKGLAAGIKGLVGDLNESGRIKIQLVCDTNEETFDPSRSTLLYRVVQEMLTNTIKHAAAATVKISLVTTEHELLFQYADDGRGFSMKLIEKSGVGNGLRNICSRLEILGARSELFAAPGEGVHFKINILLSAMKQNKDVNQWNRSI